MEDETDVHFPYAVRNTFPNVPTFLSKISDIISSDMTVFSDEHLYHILIYGSNVHNSVSNGLIITKTIKYIRNSGRSWKHSDRKYSLPLPP